jgi:hypothetical protein
MTGSPGIPPGCVVLKCVTGSDIKEIVARKNTPAMNSDVVPRKTFLQGQNQKSRIERRAGIYFI